MARRALLIGLLLVLVPGCGGDRKLSKEQYVARLDAACEDFAAREKQIGEPNTVDELVTRGPRVAVAFDETILEVGDRKAPDEIARQARRLTDLAKRQHDVLHGLATAAKAGDVNKVGRLAAENSLLNDEAASVARELGASSCAGSG